MQPQNNLRATLLLATSAVLAIGHAGAQARLQPADPAKAAALTKSIDDTLLPRGGSAIHADQKQIMSLSGPHPVHIVPVRYQYQAESGGGAPFFQCGLVFIPSSGEKHLVITFGTDWTETESCTALAAIGTASTATPPDLSLVYTASSLRSSFPEPVLLRWDASSSTYKPDAETSQWLGEQKSGHSIAGIRALLASRKNGKP